MINTTKALAKSEKTPSAIYLSLRALKISLTLITLTWRIG